jgi:hypothetical protein
MSHELSSLALENIRKILSSAPDILTQDQVDQTIQNANAYPWTTSKVTGSMDVGSYGDSDMQVLSTNDIGSLSAGATGSLSSGTVGFSASTIGPYIYTTNATGATSWSPGNISPGNISLANTQFEQSGKMSLKGQNADIEINGKSMSAWMDKIEQRLNILTPNPDMEKEWDDLRRLGERYRKLEKKCQEKSQMWEALKKMQPPNL